MAVVVLLSGVEAVVSIGSKLKAAGGQARRKEVTADNRPLAWSPQHCTVPRSFLLCSTQDKETIGHDCRPQLLGLRLWAMSAFPRRTLERINDTPKAFPSAGLGSFLLGS